MEAVLGVGWRLCEECDGECTMSVMCEKSNKGYMGSGMEVV